jgi:hypothetical protein
MNGHLERFDHACLHVYLEYPSSFSSTLNKGARLGNGFVTVHVKIDLFRDWIVIISKYDLFSAPHMFIARLL